MLYTLYIDTLYIDTFVNALYIIHRYTIYRSIHYIEEFESTIIALDRARKKEIADKRDQGYGLFTIDTEEEGEDDEDEKKEEEKGHRQVW